MKIEVGQLRRWRGTTASSGSVFLVMSIDDEPITPGSPVWVSYLQDEDMRYDDTDWVQEHSEAVQ